MENKTQNNKGFKTLAYIDAKHIERIGPKSVLWDLDSKVVHDAYEKIYVSWNKDIKQRNYIKHLVGAFLPYESFNRMLFVEKSLVTGILGINATGIKNISEGVTEFSMSKMMADCRVNLSDNKTEYSSEDQKIMEDIRNKMPAEIKGSIVAVGSKKSDKVLCVEEIIALTDFCENAMLLGDPEIHSLVKAMMHKRSRNNNFLKSLPQEVQDYGTSSKPAKTKPKTHNVSQQLGISGIVDDKTMSALEKLKLKMEESENGK